MVQVGRPKRPAQQPPMIGGASYLKETQRIRTKDRTALLRASDARFPFVSHTCPQVFSGVLRTSDIVRIGNVIIGNHSGANRRVELKQLGTTQNNQPIVAITVLPEKRADGTAIFYAGSHAQEYAGPHAVLNLLDLTLEALKDPGSAVSDLLGNKALIFVPLANPDGALFEPNEELKPFDFMGQPIDAQGYLYDAGAFHNYLGAKLRPETELLKHFIKQMLQEHGQPFLSIDFHESTLACARNRRNHRYAFAPIEIVKTTMIGSSTSMSGIVTEGEVLENAISAAIEIFGKKQAGLLSHGSPSYYFTRQPRNAVSFTDWTAKQDCRSFIVETPLQGFHVGDRVLLAMLAVQEIFQQLD